MKIKKMCTSIIYLFLVVVSSLSFSYTFAKFTYKSSGLAYLIEFTKFLLLDDAFIIEDVKGDFSNKFFGPEDSVYVPTSEESFLEMSEEQYNDFIDGVNQYIEKNGKTPVDWPDYNENGSNYKEIMDILNEVYADEFFDDETMESYKGYYFFPDSEFLEGDSGSFWGDDDTFVHPDYLISNIKNVVYTVYNNTEEDMIITFGLHYYAQKTSNSANAISFGLYNTSKRGDSLDTNNANIVKGEFPNITKNSAQYVFYEQTIPNVCVKRSGGSVKVEDDKVIDNIEYYPHATIVNPYEIKKKPTLVNEDYIDYNISTVSATNASYMDDDFDLNDFIIKKGEMYDFNLSLYYGGYGSNNNNADFSFLAAIELRSEPISKYPDIANYL